MITIKVKKEMNERELIKYLVDHENTNIYSSGISRDGAWISIKPEIESKVGFQLKEVSKDGKIFTVEVEEEITEDTKLDLIERFISGPGSACYKSHGNKTIKECSRRSPEKYTTTHFYIENDYRELVLIWTKEKGLL